MIKRIEHLGVAVSDIERSEHLFTALLGRSPYKKETVKGEGVFTTFYGVGESKIELVSSDDPESPIGRYLEKKGEGIHHVALYTDDIDGELKRLKEEGFGVIGEPHAGADGKRVCFLHPKTTNGVLFELCEDRD